MGGTHARILDLYHESILRAGQRGIGKWADKRPCFWFTDLQVHFQVLLAQAELDCLKAEWEVGGLLTGPVRTL